MTDTTELLAAAATALAGLLPAARPLSATPTDNAPDASREAVVADFVGIRSVQVAVVVDPTLSQALTGTGVTIADALRPALEAATEPLGPGVLSDATTAPVGPTLEGTDVHLFELSDGDKARAWVAIRITHAPETSTTATALDREKFKVLYDVDMTLSAEVGRTRLPLRQVLDLVPGSVLELDRPAGAPADILVNGRLIARGEIVVVGEDYAVRIAEVVSAEAPE